MLAVLVAAKVVLLWRLSVGDLLHYNSCPRVHPPVLYHQALLSRREGQLPSASQKGAMQMMQPKKKAKVDGSMVSHPVEGARPGRGPARRC